MCDAYRRQYGFDAFTVMPSNVYGVGDNFDPASSHVVAGLMRRFHEAKETGDAEVVAWGTGSPMRELVDADDLARLIDDRQARPVRRDGFTTCATPAILT